MIQIVIVIIHLHKQCYTDKQPLETSVYGSRGKNCLQQLSQEPSIKQSQQ